MPIKSKPMSKTRDEAEGNDFWSAHKFRSQATALLDWLESSGIQYKIGRSCCHIGASLKMYPHWKGKSNNTVSLVRNGKEIATFVTDVVVSEVIKIIKVQLEDENHA